MYVCKNVMYVCKNVMYVCMHVCKHVMYRECVLMYYDVLSTAFPTFFRLVFARGVILSLHAVLLCMCAYVYVCMYIRICVNAAFRNACI